MDNNINNPNNPRNGKALVGVILLMVGGILLLQQYIIPDWVKLWPLWLIGWGVFIGVRSNFQKSSFIVLMGLGLVFLFTENIHNSERIFWPIVIIAFGLWMILRRHSRFDKDHWEKSYKYKWQHYYNPGAGQDPGASASDATYTEVPPTGGPSGYPPTGDDYLDAVSVFGGVKKTILSKDFKGGEIVNIFGGAELDFTQADINGRVIIDITQIFGGTKIIVPSNWQVVSDLAAVFAGVDDKRMRSTAAANSEKILVLKGVSIFAGVDIRSF
jgi:predicted membrane protein